MKTKIDIADSLLGEARAVAAKEGIALRSLVEEGIRLAIARRSEGPPFLLRDASFGEGGLRSGVSLERWDDVRGLIYSGRGG